MNYQTCYGLAYFELFLLSSENFLVSSDCHLKISANSSFRFYRAACNADAV